MQNDPRMSCPNCHPVRAENARLRALAEKLGDRVGELEARWRDFMEWDESAVLYNWKERAEAAEAKLARIVELHKGVICCGPKCKAQDHEICCQHCSGPDCAPWPCPTVAAARGNVECMGGHDGLGCGPECSAKGE